MKRRWIALGFLVVALGAWLIFSGKQEGWVSIRFLGYHTNDANERSAVFWITNGHHFPVIGWSHVTTNRIGIGGTVEAIKEIGGHSGQSRRIMPKQLAQIPTSRCELEISTWRAPPYSGVFRLRMRLERVMDFWQRGNGA